MSGTAPPLRFLIAVIGGWIAVRAATFAFWLDDPAPTRALVPEPVAIARPTTIEPASGPSIILPVRDRPAALSASVSARASTSAPDAFLPHMRCCPVPMIVLPATTPTMIGPAQSNGPSIPPPPLASAIIGTRATIARWTASAWLLARRDVESRVLAPGGTLGGSQAGGRVTYRLSGEEEPLIRLSGRAYLPLRQTSGAEAAIGLDWQPVARLPLYLLAERREALGSGGRSAFSLTLYGGRSAQLPLGVRLDSYAQAGIVGMKSRDLFVDGAVQLRRPVGPVEIGAGAWGAAQPGAARLDIGPEISVRLPAERAHLRLSVDWRFRVVGDAAPGSGPALTLGADF